MLPECHKTTYNVIGFQTPEAAGEGVGQLAGRQERVGERRDPHLGGLQPRLREVQARQGRADAQPRHERDVRRDVRPLASCSGTKGRTLESLEVGRLDCISFPPGCARRFENITRERARRRAHAALRHRRRRAAERVHPALDGARGGVRADRALAAGRTPRLAGGGAFCFDFFSFFQIIHPTAAHAPTKSTRKMMVPTRFDSAGARPRRRTPRARRRRTGERQGS